MKPTKQKAIIHHYSVKKKNHQKSQISTKTSLKVWRIQFQRMISFRIYLMKQVIFQIHQVHKLKIN